MLRGKTVMSYSDDTQSSKGKRRVKVTPAGSERRHRRRPLDSTGGRHPPRRNLRASGTGGRWLPKLPMRTYGDVLEPCGITIQNKGEQEPPQTLPHPGVPPDPKDRPDAYRETHTLNVWLDPDTERIQREYKAMRVYDATRPNTRHTPCGHIPRRTETSMAPEEDSDQRWLPIRMLQLVRSCAR